MLTKLDFNIDWPLLKADYYSQTNSTLRNWFEVIDFDLREQIKKAWIADMECLHVSIPFFLWFPHLHPNSDFLKFTLSPV